ncbi:MAG: hypothetical protein IPO69_15975 [Saprospiraceae bacterium]|nr:hypothetical protein [Saprospiraceae bacterium]
MPLQAHYIGLHFQSYDDFILPQSSKAEYSLLNASGSRTYHHLPEWLRQEVFQHHLTQIKALKFHCFLPHITEISVHQNITFYPIQDELFTQKHDR